MIEQLYATKQEAFEAGKAVGRLDLDDFCKKRISMLESHLLVMTEHATNKAGGYLAKNHPDVLRARELTK